MSALAQYATPDTLPGSESLRIARLLGLKDGDCMDRITLAERVAKGFRPTAVTALGQNTGMPEVANRLIPEATLRRARKSKRPLSREMSERLYEVSRVIDAVSRTYHGDREAVGRFLNSPHQLLGGKTPLAVAKSSSAGADAVIALVQQANASFAV